MMKFLSTPPVVEVDFEARFPILFVIPNKIAEFQTALSDEFDSAEKM